MALRSSTTRYGSVAIAIHWLSAVAVVFMLGSGLAMGSMADPTPLLRVHVVTGVVVGLLTVLRIVWWLAFDRRPADPAALGRVHALAARLVHYALYAVILVLVASGMATLLITDALAPLFGAAPGPLPAFEAAPPFAAHSLLFKVLIVLALGHVGAALWHQFVRGDRLLARMGLGR